MGSIALGRERGGLLQSEAMADPSSDSGSDKLTLLDGIAMAMGGMIGGGIFAVLGEGVRRAGNATFLAFGLAGLLALLTGLAYSRLTLKFDEPGGSFSFVEELVGGGAAGTLSWFLLLGYTFTIALYAHTFAAYGGNLLGLEGVGKTVLGVVIIGALAGLNLIGVRESGITEDILVYGKIAILLVVAVAGLITVDPAEAFPIFERGGGGAITTAALIFVAYEGFQLLTYDYDDIRDKHTTLPRIIYIAIPATAAIYMLVAFATTGSLSDAVVAQHSETVLAYAARPLLGRVGITAVLVAAVFSTASAINATIFASARLADRVTDDGQMPDFVTRWKSGGVPIIFVALTAGIAAVIQATAHLGQITAFSSLVFLLVFVVVNATALPHGVFRSWRKVIPVAGMLGCAAAVAALGLDLFRHEPGTLVTVGAIAAGVLLARVAFLALRAARSDP